MLYAEWIDYLPSFWEWFPIAIFIAIFLLPFALFGYLVRKRQRAQRGYNDNSYSGPPIA